MQGPGIASTLSCAPLLDSNLIFTCWQANPQLARLPPAPILSFQLSKKKDPEYSCCPFIPQQQIQWLASVENLLHLGIC